MNFCLFGNCWYIIYLWAAVLYCQFILNRLLLVLIAPSQSHIYDLHSFLFFVEIVNDNDDF